MPQKEPGGMLRRRIAGVFEFAMIERKMFTDVYPVDNTYKFVFVLGHSVLWMGKNNTYRTTFRALPHHVRQQEPATSELTFDREL